MSNTVNSANADLSRADTVPIKATLLLTSTLTVMSGATIAPSLPAMQMYFADVENSALLVRLVLTIPALLIAVGGMFAGQLVDRLGRKSLLLVATFVYGLAGASGFMLNSLGAILFGRGILGLAVAGIMTSATTLIADYYQGQQRANFMGLQAAFMGLGGVVFLSVGGFVADLNWRFPFLIYLSAWGILIAIALTLYEPERSVDRPTDNSSNYLYNKHRSIPFRVLGMIYGVALFYMVTFYLIPVQLPFYLQSLGNESASAAGLAIAASTLASSIASLRYGFVKRHFGYVKIVVLAFAVAAVGYVIIGLSGSYNLVLLGLIIVGLGFGLLMPNLNVWLSSIVPDTLRGRALGGLTTFFFLGQFLSPIITQPISNTLSLGQTYIVAGIALAAIALVFLTLNRQIKTWCQNC